MEDNHAKLRKPIVKVKGKPHDRRKGAVKAEKRSEYKERIAGNMAKFYGKKVDSVAAMVSKV